MLEFQKWNMRRDGDHVDCVAGNQCRCYRRNAGWAMSNGTFDDLSGCASLAFPLVFLGGFFFWNFFPENARQILYSVEYGVTPERVAVYPKPKDCDFFQLPYGFKSCSYDVVVENYRRDGKDYVTVFWKRKER
jgi:hypothetical protein